MATMQHNEQQAYQTDRLNLLVTQTLHQQDNDDVDYVEACRNAGCNEEQIATAIALGEQLSHIEYDIVDHGIEHEQYFQGCGTAHTKYEHCFTGCGEDAREALEDALEQMASSGFDLGQYLDVNQILADEDIDHDTTVAMLACNGEHEDFSNHHYYVSIRF